QPDAGERNLRLLGRPIHAALNTRSTGRASATANAIDWSVRGIMLLGAALDRPGECAISLFPIKRDTTAPQSDRADAQTQAARLPVAIAIAGIDALTPGDGVLAPYRQWFRRGSS